MKKIFWILTTIVVASCSFDDNDNETLYETYGVVKEDANISGKLYVRSDDGKAVHPSLSNLLSNEDRDTRVWMTFSTANDITSDTTIKANVYHFLRITPMDFKTYSDESASSTVYLWQMWVAQDYLTFVMDVNAGSENSLKEHKYTMYLKEEVNDTARMEFKYDRNSDTSAKSFTKVVALKLDDKVNAKVLAIKFNTDSGIKEKFVQYIK
ncbi:MAG: hypothetical protein LBD76_00735 [Prevotellaceae bacterium]|nr:hypothetical protein [Prevotellaceae bacterium]